MEKYGPISYAFMKSGYQRKKVAVWMISIMLFVNGVSSSKDQQALFERYQNGGDFGENSLNQQHNIRSALNQQHNIRSTLNQQHNIRSTFYLSIRHSNRNDDNLDSILQPLELIKRADKTIGGIIGITSKRDTLSNDDMCHLVCSYCAEQLGRRWAALCIFECESGNGGNSYDNCFSLWQVTIN
ncbi:unnamed protein product [Owenia fusiformis]|uniref:Uncharacterized protein n=1 Tax=Owenia fusiformis TaxID=6347 RepID=A0A8J1XZW7_OWEFU|nr:unnamed protein product [Owenia fusiformis]